ncbi:MAG: polysaccharide pyruvyl transferase family protein [Clostridium sp.]|nr:polysaccharide pyruvyl transferase family protein [Clostridium sp.]
MSLKVLITGANYNNKGAQSMLFVTVDEVKKRIPESEVYFGCGLNDPVLKNVSFQQICFSREGRYIALGGGQAVFNFFVAVAKAVMRAVTGKHTNILRIMDVKKYMKEMDLVVDISGFALGDKWSKRTNENFLNTIRLAKRYQIPIFIMPQSFGPFDYPPELQYIEKEIRELLAYPVKVFAREEEGYGFLVGRFGLDNVEHSYDLVLQNKGINLRNLYQEMPERSVPLLETQNNVGIIPNAQCFRHGDREAVLHIYKVVIERILSAGREVYVFRHSGEDLPYCRMIVEMLEGERHIHLLENDFSCLEFDELVQNFEFIVCSRYHGIVHAYKNDIPVIAFGWAVKYRELTKAVGQLSYLYDITEASCDKGKILDAVDQMLVNCGREKKIIRENMLKLQSENCFEYLSEWVGKDNE